MAVAVSDDREGATVPSSMAVAQAATLEAVDVLARLGTGAKGLPADPMEAFRQSGYLERITRERSAKNAQNVTSYA